MTKEAIADLTGFEHIEVYGAREHKSEGYQCKNSTQ
jgi:hypothetical protein